MLDMLMTDRPIVTTTQGTRGLPAEVVALLQVADTAEAFAAAVAGALGGRAIDVLTRSRVRQQFSVDGLGAALRNLAPGFPVPAARAVVETSTASARGPR